MEVKCKEHPFELGPGVCAACLRSRLLAIIAATQSASASAISPTSPPSSSSHQRNQHNYHPAVAAAFPRSASPTSTYRRRSVDESTFPHHRPHPLFYSTPQVAPRAPGAGSAKKRFAILTSLFRADKDRQQHHPDHRSDPKDTSSPAPAMQDRPSSSASAPTTSWFTALVPGMRRSGRLNRNRDPEAENIELPSTQTFSSSPAWRAPTHTPARPAAPQQHKAASGFSVCLSPLVRASPGHWRSQVGAGEVGMSGELSGCGRRRGRHQPDAASALGPNRSRKLVDFGRPR